jgi:hypothetical protein
MNELAKLKAAADDARETHFRLVREAFYTRGAKAHEDAYYAGLRAKAAHLAFVAAMLKSIQEINDCYNSEALKAIGY